MTKEIMQLLSQIEQLRVQLEDLLKDKELFDPEVIEASEKLDRALNEYLKKVGKDS